MFQSGWHMSRFRGNRGKTNKKEIIIPIVCEEIHAALCQLILPEL